MPYLFTALLGYSLGCINPAYILARIKGFDIHEKGSGNAGASNALITMGKLRGFFCAAFDIAKAALAVLLARLLFPNVDTFAVSASCAILGHIFPFYLRFRGGKGLACLCGAVLTDSPVSFYLTFSPLPDESGGIFSVALILPAAYGPPYPPVKEDFLLCAVRTFLFAVKAKRLPAVHIFQ